MYTVELELISTMVSQSTLEARPLLSVLPSLFLFVQSSALGRTLPIVSSDLSGPVLRSVTVIVIT